MFGIETLLSLLAPYDCLICGREGPMLCQLCLPNALKPLPARCFRCKTTDTDGICEPCSAETGLSSVLIAASYEGPIQQIIRHYKFDRAKDNGLILAAALTRILPDPDLPAKSLTTYIPTASSRVRERGYDHARLVAKAYGRLQGRKISHVLARSGQTRQVGASRHKRLSQLDGAFRLRAGAQVAGKDIWLIDDVVTTGATLQAAARLLKIKNARSVSALVVAQKV